MKNYTANYLLAQLEIKNSILNPSGEALFSEFGPMLIKCSFLWVHISHTAKDYFVKTALMPRSSSLLFNIPNFGIPVQDTLRAMRTDNKSISVTNDIRAGIHRDDIVIFSNVYLNLIQYGFAFYRICRAKQ